MSTERKDFNYQINGLRGLCILLVFVYHVYNSGFVPVSDASPLGYFISTFKYGVEVFFMISGYVILNSIRRHPNLRAFFIDRSLRIHPTWVPLHLITFVGAPLLGKTTIDAGTSLSTWGVYFVSALLLMPPVVPLPLFHPAAWTLSYEWCFYLLIGGLFFLLGRKVQQRVAFAMVIAVAVTFINYFPRALFFIPGVIAAVYEPWIVSHRRYFAFSGVALVTFLLTWGGTGANPAQVTVLVSEWFQDSRILFAALALIAGIYAFASIVAGKGLLVTALLHPIMQFLGKISYAFYLWSPLVFFPVKALSRKFLEPMLGLYPAFAIFIGVSFVLSLIVAWLNWALIEQRLTRWLRSKLVKPRKIEAAL